MLETSTISVGISNFRKIRNKIIVCACPYSSNIGLSAMTLYYPVQDKTTTQPVNTQNSVSGNKVRVCYHLCIRHT